MTDQVSIDELREAAAEPGTVIRGTGQPMRLLRRPVEQGHVHDRAGVKPALRRVEEAAGQGLTAVVALAYEAAPAFDSACVVRPDWTGPLLWYALYEREERVEPAPAPEPPLELGPWTATVTDAEHAAGVARVRELIAAGDTYQVNLTHRLRTRFEGDPLALACQLWGAQGVSNGSLCHLGDRIVISASPELFFKRDAGGRVAAEPMKGTRPRGRTRAEDLALRDALLASAKDRAENLMIVDMVRNDLGRVALPGSVRVPGLYEVVPLPTAWQMISEIRAVCPVPLDELFAALFPCASITGAPKVRTMQIIAALETTPRGFYTGAIGSVDRTEARFDVAIRTLQLDLATRQLEYGVGGGIVWDSVAQDEWAECATKALVLDRPGNVRLVETLLWEPEAGWLLLDEHLARLFDTAAVFGYPAQRPYILASLEAAVAGARSAQRVRMTLGVDGQLGLTVTDLPPARPWRVGLAAEPVHTEDRRLYFKTTDRRLYDRARAARPDCDDVILHNERGELTESSVANLVLRLDGEWVTPPLECGLLPGVYRGVLLARGVLRERVLTPPDLARAEAVCLINSVRRWIEVELVDQPPAGVSSGLQIDAKLTDSD